MGRKDNVQKELNESVWLLVDQGLIEEWKKNLRADQIKFWFDSEKLKNCTWQETHVYLRFCGHFIL